MNILRTTLLTALLLQAGHTIAGEAIDETRDVDADAVIDIEIPHGVLTVTAWDENRVHITGELSDRADGYDLRSVGGGIRFKEESDRSYGRSCWSWGWNNRCNYDESNQSNVEIQVPRASVLRIEGINLEVRADGLHGSTDVDVVNGDVIATDLRGTVRLQTTNGDIETDRLNGRVTLTTVNGSIDDTGSDGGRISLTTVNGSIDSITRSPRVSVDSTNGSIELETGPLDELNLSSVNGRLEVTTELNDLAQVDITSVGGRIDLTVPAATSAQFNISTAVGGRITNQLSDDEPERKNRYVNSLELDFSLNGGNGDVSISTVSGNVTLRSQ